MKCNQQQKYKTQDVLYSGPVTTAPQEFENRAFTLKTHHVFRPRGRSLKNATITGHFVTVLEENSFREIT